MNLINVMSLKFYFIITYTISTFNYLLKQPEQYLSTGPSTTNLMCFQSRISDSRFLTLSISSPLDYSWLFKYWWSHTLCVFLTGTELLRKQIIYIRQQSATVIMYFYQRKKILSFSGNENIMMNARGRLLFSNALHCHTYLAYTLFNLVLISW